MSIGRFFLNNKGNLVFICPFCGNHHEETMKDFQGRDDKTTVACSCGNAYQVQVELRKYYRKKTCLEGMYKKLTPPQASGRMYVIDISLSGCRIDASLSHQLKVGDRIGLAFTLNNDTGKMIKKEAIVQAVSGGYVGCEFAVVYGTYDADLGFFLRIP